MLLIQEAEEPPANRCPLVPVRMPVDVDGWPERGEAIPVEVEERAIGAIDNRRLAGKVAKLLIEHVALPRSAATAHRQQAKRTGSAGDEEKAAGYALEVRDRGRKALRGVDLDELIRAVKAEAVKAEVEVRPSPVSADPPPSLDKSAKTAELRVQFPSKKLAVVIEGQTTVRVRGVRQVWVFKTVVEAAGRPVSWADLVSMDRGAAEVELQRRGRAFDARRQRQRDFDEADQDDLDEADDLEGPAMPRMALRRDSLQRVGNRIRKALGKLGYHWNQDGEGACWSAEVS